MASGIGLPDNSRLLDICQLPNCELQCAREWGIWEWCVCGVECSHGGGRRGGIRNDLAWARRRRPHTGSIPWCCGDTSLMGTRSNSVLKGGGTFLPGRAPQTTRTVSIPCGVDIVWGGESFYTQFGTCGAPARDGTLMLCSWCVRECALLRFCALQLYVFVVQLGVLFSRGNQLVYTLLCH